MKENKAVKDIKHERMLSKNRQTAMRNRRKQNGSQTLQLRISIISHLLVKQISKATGTPFATVYANAINYYANNSESLPQSQSEVLTGDNIGTQQIAPWITLKERAEFERIATHYETRSIALSAITYSYCLAYAEANNIKLSHD